MIAQQRDLFRHSPQALASAHRVAADTERHNPYFTPAERAARAAQHLAEAARLERLAGQARDR